MRQTSNFPVRSTALGVSPKSSERSTGTNSFAAATLLGVAWLALFALFYSIGEEVGAWPSLPLGGLVDLDLVVGFLAGAAVLVVLLASGRTLRTES